MIPHLGQRAQAESDLLSAPPEPDTPRRSFSPLDPLWYTARMTLKNPTSLRRLEERITHCERLAETLDGVVTDLQKRVLALEAQNRKLVAELQQQRQAQEALRSDGPADERPPHY